MKDFSKEELEIVQKDVDKKLELFKSEINDLKEESGIDDKKFNALKKEIRVLPLKYEMDFTDVELFDILVSSIDILANVTDEITTDNVKRTLSVSEAVDLVISKNFSEYDPTVMAPLMSNEQFREYASRASMEDVKKNKI